ncbi:MAG TPA: helix-turn-helix domain-containing protein [Bacteroidia bacterium]|nr:helix-turn-helix domain-containing protein [Bacteroidia bacterium]
MFYLAGIFIAFFLSLLLWGKKNKSLADKVLAAWLTVVGLHLLQFFIYISGRLYDFPWLLGVGFPFPLLHGPFLLLYVCSLSGQITKIGLKALTHFVPAGAEYLYLIPFMLRPASEKIRVFQQEGAGYEVFTAIQSALIPLSGVVYVIWSIIQLNRHERNILYQFSDIEKINLRWLRYLIYSLALIWVFVLLKNDTLVYSSAVCFVLFIGYWGINQVGIFDQQNTVKPDEIEIEEDENPIPENLEQVPLPEPDKSDASRKKYARSGLSEETAAELHKKLLELMEKDKPYKESGLTLTDLASRLNTVPNYLSQVINHKQGTNFYDYINTLRVEEFKKMASQPGGKKYNLLGMAYECGFNSKSSFNKYFRKMNGISPTEYFKS